MAASSKTTRIIIFVVALCGGIVGAFVGTKLSHRLQLNGIRQIALVVLGAVGSFGTVWFFYWVSQNLFSEDDGKPH